jgi:hypothetical protein
MFGDFDFGTHVDVNENLIAGFVVPGSQEIFQLEDGSGRTGVKIIGKIWKHYAPKLMSIFKRKTNKSVSVEMGLLDSEQLSDGFTKMKDFIYFGICVLGDLITEASPGANMEMVSFTAENKKYKEAYAKEFSNKSKPHQYKSRYAEIDFTINEDIKQNALNGIEMSKSGKTASAVYMAVGRHLSSSEKVSSDKVRFINKKINSKLEFDEDTNEHLSFLLMGGNPAIEWSKNIVDQMNEKDSKVVSYFEKPNNKEMEVELMDKVKEEVKEEEMAVEEKVEKTEDMSAEKVEEKTEDMAADSKKDEEKETSEEEKSETPEEEKKEEEKGVEKKMSLDAYVDVSATMAMLVKETENNKELADKYASGELEDGEFASAMFTAMCNMSKKLEEFAAENMSLKEFKADVEKQQFQFQVESFMQEVVNSLPAEEFAKAKEDSANFSIDNLNDWKNKVKATAFNFSRDKKPEKKDYIAIAMPFLSNQSNSGDTKSPWKR